MLLQHNGPLKHSGRLSELASGCAASRVLEGYRCHPAGRLHPSLLHEGVAHATSSLAALCAAASPRRTLTLLHSGGLCRCLRLSLARMQILQILHFSWRRYQAERTTSATNMVWQGRTYTSTTNSQRANVQQGLTLMTARRSRLRLRHAWREETGRETGGNRQPEANTSEESHGWLP